MSILDYKASREEWLDRIKEGSVNSGEAYFFGIQKWDEFLSSINETDEDTLKELKAKQSITIYYPFDF